MARHTLLTKALEEKGLCVSTIRLSIYIYIYVCVDLCICRFVRLDIFLHGFQIDVFYIYISLYFIVFFYIYIFLVLFLFS